MKWIRQALVVGDLPPTEQIKIYCFPPLTIAIGRLNFSQLIKLSVGLVNLRFISGGVFMATKIRPLHDRVIVRRIEEEEKTKGGIIIPDTAKEKPQEGKVVAVGPGRHEDGKVIPLGVKAGDKILFGKYSGTEIKLDGEEHLIMREDDILGVIE
jgi:chaperonin GroES